MSAEFDRLLEATIQHLEELKGRGARTVQVSRDALRALSEPLPPGVSGAGGEARRPEAASAPVQIPKIESSTPKDLQKKESGKAPASKASETGTEISLPLGSSGNSPAAAAMALGPEAKAAAFASLRQRAMACVKCANLAAARRNVVFGVGNINAGLMFIGEAPGADEDEQGEPFVGKAGKLLTKIIEAMGLRRADVYIGNILKCRPDTPGQSSGNRKPTAEEMAACIPFLHEQIDLIGPKVLVALGATAVEGLLGKTIGITRLRGAWKTYRGIPLMPTYHPAYLLRNQALSEKRKVWEDMLQVMEKLELPISEKQRRFFLKTDQ